MKYKQISNIPKKKYQKISFPVESHFKNSFFKDSNKGRTDYLVHGLKINISRKTRKKRRGRTTIKVSESQIRESNGDD